MGMRVVVGIIVLITLMSGLSVMVHSAAPENFEEQTMEITELLRINNNTDFKNFAENYSWKGNGTADNPYVIENVSISSGSYGIFIGNTSVFFVIENASISGMTYLGNYYNGAGIVLWNVSNGSVKDANIYNCTYGIFLKNASNVRVSNITINDTEFEGISIMNAENISVNESYVENSGYAGIVIYNSTGAEVENTSVDGAGAGILMKGTRNSTLSGNEITNITAKEVSVPGGYHDDFESGAAGWSHTDAAGTTWQLGTPGAGPSSAHSGSNCWGTNLDGNYGNNADSLLISPEITLKSNYLTFWQWYDTESCCDYAQVEISTDNGNTWTELEEYRGNSGGWRFTTIDVSKYMGEKVRFGFLFTSDGSVTYEGWYIDDFALNKTISSGIGISDVDGFGNSISSNEILTSSGIKVLNGLQERITGNHLTGEDGIVVKNSTAVSVQGNRIEHTAKEIPTRGLVAYWNFNEGSGNVLHDMSGHGNDGTIYGAKWVKGISGDALSFNGQSDYVEVPESPSLYIDKYQITMSVAINYKSFDNVYGYVIEHHDRYGYLVRVYNNGTIGILLSNHAVYSKTKIESGVWYIIEVTYDGKYAKIYINGKQDTSVYLPDVYIGQPNPDQDLYIGSANELDHFFNGTIDEVRIYNRALSAEEIKELYLADSLNAGLVAYWNFNEGSGNILHDVSGHGNNGTIYGAKWVKGIRGDALSFNGQGDYVEIPDSNSLRVRNLTITAWIKIQDYNQWNVIISKSTATANTPSYELNVAKDVGHLRYWANKENIDSTSQVPINTWVFVGISINENRIHLYINGMRDGTGNGGVDTYDNYPLFIGTDYPSARDNDGNFFNGTIDEVRIYNRALSAEEIKELYLADSLNAGLVAHYNFNEGSGNILHDVSGHGNDGTIHGATWTSGIKGDALEFNGNSYVYLDNPSTSSNPTFDNPVYQRTVTVWYRTDNVGGTQVLYEEGGNVNGLNMYIKNGYVYVGAWSEDNNWNGAFLKVSTTPDEWHIVTYVFNANKSFSMYYDGEFVESVAVPTYIAEHDGDDAIGAMIEDTKMDNGDQSGDGYYFNGMIDEFRVYNSALSAEEIDEIYRATFAGYGIQATNMTHSTVYGNDIENKTYGIYLENSDNNTFVNNRVENSSSYGMYIVTGNNNLIYNNTLYYNRGSGDRFNASFVQAYDNGNNRWNTSAPPGSNHGYGNYWYEWANNNNTNDQNGDGIVDWSYHIDGGAVDYYPEKSRNVSLPPQEPTAPLDLRGTSESRAILLEWRAPIGAGSTPISEYRIYRNGVLIGTTNSSHLSYLDDGIEPYTTYMYYVTAVNSVGESARSNEVWASALAEKEMVAYWNFNEGSGTIAHDVSGNGNNGTIYGATWTYGVNGTALEFNRADGDHVEISASNSLKSINETFTIASWVYLRSYPTSGDHGEALFMIQRQYTGTDMSENGLVFYLSERGANTPYSLVLYDGGSDEIETDYILPLHTWVFVAVTAAQNGTLDFYVNDTLVYSTTWNPPLSIENMEHAWIGTDIDYDSDITDCLDGYVDELMLFNYALSYENISSIYHEYTPPTVPGAPRNLQAVGEQGYVHLTWDAPASDGGAPVENYNIYRNSGSSVNLIATVDNTTLEFDDHDVNGGITYTYYVAAVNNVGEGDRSNEATAKVSTAPGAPQNLRATSGMGYVTLSWNAPASNGGTEITSYRIYRGTSSGGESYLAEVSGTTLTYTDHSVKNSMTYFYYVTAVNSIGEGPKSNEVRISTPTVPGAPQNLQDRCGEGYVYLWWSAPANNGGAPVQKYIVYRDGEKIAEVSASMLHYNDTGVIEGNVYTYYVTAVNSIGEGAESNEVAGVPVRWTIQDDFSSGTGYWIYTGEAYRDPDQGNVVLTQNDYGEEGIMWFNKNITARHFIVEFDYYSTGPDGIVMMFYKDKNYVPGSGGSLGFITKNDTPVPGYGVEFDAYENPFDPSPNHVALIYSNVSNHLAYMDDYRVSDGWWHHVIVDVEPNVVYVYLDGALELQWNGTLHRDYGGFGFAGATGGLTGWHVIDNVKIWGALPPAPPQNVKGVVKNGHVVISWTPPGEKDITGYKIYRDGQLIASVGKDSTSYTDTNVTPGKSYTYYVTSISAGGESEPSNSVKVQVPTSGSAGTKNINIGGQTIPWIWLIIAAVVVAAVVIALVLLRKRKPVVQPAEESISDKTAKQEPNEPQTIQISCPYCGYTDTVPAEFKGKTVKCPNCGNIFKI